MVLIPNVADARDVVQEAAVALWDKIDQYVPAKPFAPWACRFALNEAKMFLRKKSRQNRLADEVARLGLASRFSFSGYGEPLLHKRFADMVRCLRQRLPENTIEINTNGDRLTVTLKFTVVVNLPQRLSSR